MKNRKGTALRAYRFHGIAAKLRAFWHTIVRNMDDELCYTCGRPYDLWWCDDNQLWARVIKATTFRDGCYSGLCCPSCFDRKARAIGVILEWCPRVFRECSPSR